MRSGSSGNVFSASALREITARVRSVSNTHAWAKAGVMFRQSPESIAQSPHVMVVVTPGKGVAMQYRPQFSAPSLQVAVRAGVAPQWVRLTQLDTFKGYVSRMASPGAARNGDGRLDRGAGPRGDQPQQRGADDRRVRECQRAAVLHSVVGMVRLLRRPTAGQPHPLLSGAGRGADASACCRRAPGITQRNEIRCRALGPRELKDELLVLESLCARRCLTRIDRKSDTPLAAIRSRLPYTE